jgi:hypothetical protein
MSFARLLIVVLAVPIAVFSLWGSWEMVRQTPSAPLAPLGALAFLAIGLGLLVCAALGARARAH